MEANLKVHYKSDNGEVRFQEPVTVEFRELSTAEAPLALESDDAVTRWFEGRHFRRYTLNTDYFRDFPGERDASTIVGYLQNAERPSPRGYMAHGLPNERGPTDGSLTGGYFDNRPMSADRKFTEARHPTFLNDANRQIAINGARNFANDCLIVDGQFWVASAEPKLVVTDERMFIDTRHRTRPLTKTELSRPYYPSNMNVIPLNFSLVHNTFSVFEMGEAQRLASDMGISPSIPSFIIHQPVAFSWDRRAEHVVGAGKLLLAHWEGQLELIPPDVGQALFKISACLWGKESDEVDLENLADALDSVVAAYRANGLGIDVVARVCEDWYSRSIEIGKPTSSLSR